MPISLALVEMMVAEKRTGWGRRGLGRLGCCTGRTRGCRAASKSDDRSSVAPGMSPADIFERFDAPEQTQALPSNFDMIMDIPVNLTVELGRTKIAIRSLLVTGSGLGCRAGMAAGEPMMLVNGCLMPGEVVGK